MTEAPMPFLGQVAALEVRTQYGVDVAVEDDLRSIMSFVLLEREAWFEDEVAFLQHSLAEGAHIVDVGANVGVYAAALAHAVGARGRVVAVEHAGRRSMSTGARLPPTQDASRSASARVANCRVSSPKAATSGSKLSHSTC
jgi:predicted methyltransferase